MVKRRFTRHPWRQYLTYYEAGTRAQWLFARMLRWGAPVEDEAQPTSGEAGEAPGSPPDYAPDAGQTSPAIEGRPSWATAFPGDELDELRTLLSDGPPATAEAMADLLDAVGAKAV